MSHRFVCATSLHVVGSQAALLQLGFTHCETVCCPAFTPVCSVAGPSSYEAKLGNAVGPCGSSIEGACVQKGVGFKVTGLLGPCDETCDLCADS